MTPMLLNASQCWMGAIDGEIFEDKICTINIIDNIKTDFIEQDIATQTITPKIQKLVIDDKIILEKTTTIIFKKKTTTKSIKKYDNLLQKIKLVLQNDTQLNDININVTVFENTVLLTGVVFSHQLLNDIENKLLVKFPMIKIINHLSVGKNKSIFDHSRDSAISAIILINFQEQTVFNPKNIKVITTNTVVYLMGSVTKNQAKFIKNIVENSVGVGEIVNLFEYKNKGS
jgi:osmotically-inducible protein OsmY